MPYQPLDDTTRRHIRALIQANLAGRDDLYAAANTFDNETLTTICRRLAEDLANNAIELQQIALACGMCETNVSEAGAELQAELMEVIHEREGDAAILEEAEECERIVQCEYDEAINESDSAGIEAVLRRHRKIVEFGKTVVGEMRSADQAAARHPDRESTVSEPSKTKE